jgi:hypothetical protein
MDLSVSWMSSNVVSDLKPNIRSYFVALHSRVGPVSDKLFCDNFLNFLKENVFFPGSVHACHL